MPKKFELHITKTDNAAFCDIDGVDNDFYLRNEIADILIATAQRVLDGENMERFVNVRDHNGNTVGLMRLR